MANIRFYIGATGRTGDTVSVQTAAGTWVSAALTEGTGSNGSAAGEYFATEAALVTAGVTGQSVGDGFPVRVLNSGGSIIAFDTLPWSGLARLTTTDQILSVVNGFAADGVTVTTGGITAASFMTGAINADAIADNAITDAKVASDVAIASVTGAVGSVTAGVNVTQVAGTAQTAGDLATALAGITSGLISISETQNSLVTNGIKVAGGGITSGSFASGAINATAIAADAITDAKVASDVTIASVTDKTGYSLAAAYDAAKTAASQTSVDTVSAKLGAWTGSLRNTVLGALQALFRKDVDATVPSDINANLGTGAGTANNTTDSVQAIRDQGDTAWQASSGGPADQRWVSDEFTVIIPKRSTGSTVAVKPLRMRTTEEVLVAVDFARVLAPGDRLATVVSAVTTNNQALTLTVGGVDRSLAKVAVAGAVAGTTYTILVVVTTDFGDTLEGQFRAVYPA